MNYCSGNRETRESYMIRRMVRPCKGHRAESLIPPQNIAVVVQLLSCVWLFMTPWTAAYQACLSTISRSLLKFMSIEFGDAVQSSYLLPPPSPLTFNLSQSESLFNEATFCTRWSVLELQLQHQSFQWISRVDFLWDWLAWFPCHPRDSKESSPALQLENISSSVVNLLYGTISNLHMTTGKNIPGEGNGNPLQYSCLENPMDREA